MTTFLKSMLAILPHRNHKTIHFKKKPSESGQNVFLAYFPTSQGEELKALWYEFEAPKVTMLVFANHWIVYATYTSQRRH